MSLDAHLSGGLTHVCQCWAIRRRDGVTLGFTDHDGPLVFDGITFMADSGLSARALSASTGLSVDNSEAVGLLQSDIVTDADIAAGRYDGAEVTNWQVQWDDVAARKVKFRGTIGEITRGGGAFTAELRGLADALNQPVGRSYLKTCSAILGDSACAVDLENPAFRTDVVLHSVEGGVLTVSAPAFANGWFAAGRIVVMTGGAAGLSAAIKTDTPDGAGRRIALWNAEGLGLRAGDEIILYAGCNKRAETCQAKFSNFINFQGFPHLPGDDWLVSVPRADGSATGESMNR